MADLIFYTNPQSRGRIVRWMLEEVGAPYETELIPYDRMKDERYLAVHPLGKVPAIKHRDHIVTECAAICTYLADVFPEAGLGPREEEKADYYRWLFYAAGPLEAAVSNQAMGWVPTPERERMFGYGNFERAIAVVDELFSLRDYVCGDRFTAADVYVGSQIMFPMQFGMLTERDSFTRYRDRLQARDAYKRAGDIDNRAAAEMGLNPPPQPAQPQPA
jgi:glutathione S-transferase